MTHFVSSSYVRTNENKRQRPKTTFALFARFGNSMNAKGLAAHATSPFEWLVASKWLKI
jgi:hypothetical protein